MISRGTFLQNVSTLKEEGGEFAKCELLTLHYGSWT